MSESNSLEDLRKQYPNNKTHQDRSPVSERPRVHEQQRRIEWARQHKPVNSGDWFNFRRRGTPSKDPNE